MKIGLGIPVVASVPGNAFGPHLCLAAELGRMGEFVALTPVDLFPYDRARNAILEAAIKEECDYLLWVDSDTLVPRDAIDALFKVMADMGAAMTCGAYFQRGYPYGPTWIALDESRVVNGTGEVHFFRTDANKDHSPILLYAGGMGCNLLDVKWLTSHVEPPYFAYGTIEEEGKEYWVFEDVHFYSKIRAGTGTIYGVPSVRCGHMHEPVVITDENVVALRARYIKDRQEEGEMKWLRPV